MGGGAGSQIFGHDYHPTISFDGLKHKFTQFEFGCGQCFGRHNHQICILKKNLYFERQLYVLWDLIVSVPDQR